jgi:hypothetical protein
VRAGRAEVSGGQEAGPVPEEEHRLEEGEGLPVYEEGLVPEEPGSLLSGERYHSYRRTDHHPRHCGRIPDRKESSYLPMNKYHLFMSHIIIRF